jgi:S-adenosylmethionine:tRNA ribosyltransferase-isomerase
MLRVSDLDYVLPEASIAREPVEPRDAARLMVLSRSNPGRVEHALVRDLPGLLAPGDAMVVNDSRVVPARLAGARSDTGGRVEGLFLSRVGNDERTWRVMLKAKRPKPGARVELVNAAGLDLGVALTLIERTATDVLAQTEIHTPDTSAPDSSAPDSSAPDSSAWIVRVEGTPAGLDPSAGAIALLQRVGTTPLPPYIRQARRRDAKAAGLIFDQPADRFGPLDLQAQDHAERQRLDREARDDAHDQHVYQTVYADPSKPGSVAAPTAGLHFTPALLDALARAGVARHAVTLHVGTGTFKPVETAHVEEHAMHAEWCAVPHQSAAAVLAARTTGGRVLAVGTTSARTLESFRPDQLARAATGEHACEHWTRLLITPGWRWQNVDAIMTNFHLPKSTLMAMIASFLDDGQGAGVARLKTAYQAAIDKGYRFYSYGDAMLILP